ncbi:MAG: hypothetical protein Q8Q14_09760 [Gemmatimonadales bacterium]|nr:hypothetical protein [Gemmatimonadales bacterium]
MPDAVRPLLALATLALACTLGPDLDRIVAIEVVLPDSGRVAVGDTLYPSARALDGRGDSVAAEIRWSALDTAIIAVDSTTGATVGKVAGTGRLQARVASLRSNPQSVLVQ